MELIKIDEPFNPKGSGCDRTSAHDTGKIHLSDIAKYIEYKMKFGPVGKATKWNLNVAAEVGFIWEEVLSMVLRDRYAARIGEVELDGIVGSPDGLSPYDPFGQVPIVNEEYKATWRSSNKTPDKVWYYMTQFKSYCKMLGVNVTVARILYIMGDYKGSGPQYHVYRIEFTDQELQENWDMILAHKEEMLEKGYMDLHGALEGEE